MSLFKYIGVQADGQTKSGKMTAKSEKEALDRIKQVQRIVKFVSIKAEPNGASKPKPTAKPVQRTALNAAPDPAPKGKALTKLQRMLYLQHGRCFFCDEVLPEAEASIEHLVPQSRGGGKTEGNEVVCHASLNHAFGSMDLKAKLAFILRNDGKFRCPQVSS